MFQFPFSEANRCEKKMTSDLSNSLLCHEEEQLRELVEEWHSYVSQANSFDEDLVSYYINETRHSKRAYIYRKVAQTLSA